MSSPLPKVREPIMDTPVFTLDGEQFGYVKEIHGGYFKIDVPMARDYWLSTSYIADSTLDRVTLTLRKDELEEHRLSKPGVEVEASERLAHDAVISDAEALTQRERMERELEAQNERLRAGNI
ncbi:MAG: hypothetical protein ABI577_15430 [bacterium]